MQTIQGALAREPWNPTLPHKSRGVVDVILGNLWTVWFRDHAIPKNGHAVGMPGIVSWPSIGARTSVLLGPSQKSVRLHLLGLYVMSSLGNTNGSLPPEPEGQPDDPVKDTPDDLRGEFVPVHQVRLCPCARKRTEITHASNWGPRVIGIKRGAWKRMVDTVLWYNERPMATARFPGRNSTKKNTYIYIPWGFDGVTLTWEIITQERSDARA